MTITASTVTTLTEYAEQLLTAAENALATTDEGVPPLSYITLDDPAYDCCPALIVHITGLQEALTNPIVPAEATALRPKLGGVILVSYAITVLRCAASPGNNGALPSVSAMMEAAAQVQQDGWALWNGITHAFNDGEIFDRCQGFHRDALVPVREQGGCVGWQFNLRAMIPGIPNS